MWLCNLTTYNLPEIALSTYTISSSPIMIFFISLSHASIYDEKMLQSHLPASWGHISISDLNKSQPPNAISIIW